MKRIVAGSAPVRSSTRKRSAVRTIAVALAFAVLCFFDASSFAASPPATDCTFIVGTDPASGTPPGGASNLSDWALVTCTGTGWTYFNYSAPPITGSYVTTTNSQWVPIAGAVNGADTLTVSTLNFTDSSGTPVYSISLTAWTDLPTTASPSPSPSPSDTTSPSPSPSDTATPTPTPSPTPTSTDPPVTLTVVALDQTQYQVICLFLGSLLMLGVSGFLIRHGSKGVRPRA